MLTVFLQIFSEDTVILAEVVRLKELPTSMGPTSAMDYVRRAVWDILCAGDAFLDSRSPRARGSLRWWEVIVEVYQAFFALTVSKKTETIIRSMPPPLIPRTMRREPKWPGKPTNRCHASPSTRGAPLPKPRKCPLKLPGKPAHAGYAPSGEICMNSTTS